MTLLTSRKTLLLSAVLLAAGVLSGLATSPAHAQTTVDYSNTGTFTQSSPLTRGGITATSAGVFSLSNQGLGIDGGLSVYGSALIDNAESVLFTFDAGPATGVLFNIGTGIHGGNTTSATVEVFGSSNNSLGIFAVPFNSSNYNVSAQVGSSISSFRFTGGNNLGLSLRTITYTPAVTASAVPEPSEYAVGGMFGATLLFGMVKARRKKVAASA